MDLNSPFSTATMWTLFSLFHVFMAVALWKMASRTKEEPAWFALIPVLNILLFLKLARKPLWWIALFFLPIINVLALIAAAMSLCQRFGVDKWWGLVSIVSPFNLILYLYLAFGTHEIHETHEAAAPQPFTIPPIQP